MGKWTAIIILGLAQFIMVLDGTVRPLMSTEPGFSPAASLGSSPPKNPANTTTDNTPAAAMAGIHRLSGEGGGG